MSSPCGPMKKVLCARLSTPRIGEKDGGRRLLTRTGTPSARPFFEESKDQSGKPCICRYKDLHQAVKSKKSVEIKKSKALWALTEAKDRGVDFCDASHERKSRRQPK